MIIRANKSSGYNNQLKPKKETIVDKKRIHIHFGAGALGIGLVLPKFTRSDGSLVIIQREGVDYESLSTNSIIDFSINDNVFTTAKVLRGSFDSSKIELGTNYLVITSDTETISSYLEYATSISTSVGESLHLIHKHFTNIKFGNKNLYAFENNSSNVDSLSKFMDEHNTKICVVRVIADRICTNKSVSSNGFDVTAGDYEKTYIENVNDNVNRDIVVTEELKIVSEINYRYYYKRKFYILNGLHMILALLAYNYCQEEGVSLKAASEEIPFRMLLAAMETQLNIAQMFQSLARLQGARIIKTLSIEEEYDDVFPNTNKADALKQLETYSNQIWDRFADSKDILGRILNVDDIPAFSDKYSQRLLPLIKELALTRQRGLAEIVGESNMEEISKDLLNLNSAMVNMLFKRLIFESKTKDETIEELEIKINECSK